MYIRSSIELIKVGSRSFAGIFSTSWNRGIAGETVDFVHQGTTVRLVIREGSARSKLDRLTPRRTANPKMPEKQQWATEKKVQADMWAQIEKDWAEI
jgi:hypothetical protein